ncbi:MAG TPA: hypothetical protein VF502_10460 [Stellaceae bacterium]
MARERATNLPVAAVTGLVAEARIARGMGWRAVAAGGREEGTRAAIARLIADGAAALASFGICGGLDPALRSGALILPHAVLGEDGDRYAVHAGLHRTLAAALEQAGIGAFTGDMLGAAAAADTPSRKATLHRQGGVAVDLESHLVAGAAAEARIPFIVLRAVADPAERALPPAALIGLDEEGRTALGPVLRSIARQPGQVSALLRLALDTHHALASLRRAARALGSLGHPREE